MASNKAKLWISLTLLLLTTTLVSTQEELDLNFSISENVGRNTFVGDVASEADLQNRVPAEATNMLKFQILDQNTNAFTNYFFINPQSGILRTNEAIDREAIVPCISKATCILDIRLAILSESPDFQFFQIVGCHITIQDQNDNSPVFEDNQRSYQIPEDTPVGSRIQLETADDPDSPQYGISHYTLLSTTVQEFNLVQINGSGDGSISLYLEVVQELDREKRDAFRIVVAAYDKGNKSGTLSLDIIIMDVNDNHPEFTQDVYTTNAREDMPLNEPVIRVVGVDRDMGENSELLYAFDSRTQSTYGHIFHIDNSTGRIILLSHLDYETNQQFTLFVTAKERYHNTLPVEAKVIIDVIDVNDNAPVITLNAVTQSGNLEIAENAPVGTYIGLISTEDPDSGDGGKYSCALENNIGDSFQLTATSSAYSDFMIATNKNFDREDTDQYELIFVCRDEGTPARQSTETIRVTVLDENDNAPRFTQPVYNVTVDENNAPGLFLIKVSATDEDFGENGQVEYGLYPEAMAYIEVDSVSGNVTAKIAYDYERYHLLSFGILARDHGDEAHTTTAILNIHIRNLNDEPPVFERSAYDFHVPENSAVMTSVNHVTIRSRDLALAPVMYQLEENSPVQGLFTVDSTTGTIFTATTFDAEMSPNVYQFNVLAVDSEYTNLRTQAYVKITITDVNDHPPQIQYPSANNHTVQIKSDFTVGNIITKIQASDRDVDSTTNSRMRYLIAGEDVGYFFSCDEASGEIRTVRDLDEISGSRVFNLTVTVQDAGSIPLADQANLVIMVNQTRGRSSKQSSSSSSAESLAKNDNVTIVTAVAVVSGILIVFLIIAIVVLKRKDQIKFNHKQKRIAKLFSSQKMEAKKAQEAQMVANFDSVEGGRKGYDNEVTTADEYQQKDTSDRIAADKGQKVGPWLHAQLDLNADQHSDLSDQSLGSDSGRGSHEDPDLTARNFNEAAIPVIPPRSHRLASHPSQHPHQHTSAQPHTHHPDIPGRQQRPPSVTRARRGSHDSSAYVQLARTQKLHTQIQPDHKLLYKHDMGGSRMAESPRHDLARTAASPSHNLSSQSSGYSSHQNYSNMGNLSRDDDAFLPSASYI